LDTSAVSDAADVAAKPWPISQQAYLAAVKEETSLQSSAHPSFIAANNLSSAGWHGGRQQQQQQRQRAAVQQHNSEEGRSECFCKGCVIC
jgi:hypothetical protein